MFISELLSKSISESETDTLLFDYVYNSMLWLDDAISDYVNFPIEFALGLSRFLGFYPNFDTYSEGSSFDLLDGNFKKMQNDIYQMELELSRKFYHVGTSIHGDFQKNRLTNSDRRQLLDALVMYYKLHTENIREIKSLEVLREVF